MVHYRISSIDQSELADREGMKVDVIRRLNNLFSVLPEDQEKLLC